jgi:hypothetical protein
VTHCTLVADELKELAGVGKGFDAMRASDTPSVSL